MTTKTTKTTVCSTRDRLKFRIGRAEKFAASAAAATFPSIFRALYERPLRAPTRGPATISHRRHYVIAFNPFVAEIFSSPFYRQRGSVSKLWKVCYREFGTSGLSDTCIAVTRQLLRCQTFRVTHKNYIDIIIWKRRNNAISLEEILFVSLYVHICDILWDSLIKTDEPTIGQSGPSKLRGRKIR